MTNLKNDWTLEANDERKAICALATPYRDNGKIDVDDFVRLCTFQRENGVDALLALGTTAESQLLTDCERKLLLTLAKSSAGYAPVIAGIEEPSTSAAVKQAETYSALGADALMIAPPSFCKCTPKGFVKHVEAIAKASALPIVLYNIPARAGYSLDANAVKRLAGSNLVAFVKDSSPNMSFVDKTKGYVKIMCGSDELLDRYLDRGACGVVSVACNAAPALTKRALTGDDEAMTQFKKLANAAMSELSPIAIKYILYKAGIFKSYKMRLPLTKASAKTRKAIDCFWQENGFQFYKNGEKA